MLLNFLDVGKCNEGVGKRWDLHVTELVALSTNKKKKSLEQVEVSTYENKIQIRGFFLLVKAIRRTIISRYTQRKSGINNLTLRNLWQTGFRVAFVSRSEICAFLCSRFIFYLVIRLPNNGWKRVHLQSFMDFNFIKEKC